MRRRARLAMLVLTVAIAVPAPAQERREPIRGSAVLADGTPWVSATVHLLSRPMLLDERIGTADELQATTDAKGRFTVQLLAGRFYVAWAIEELAEDHYRASLPSEGLISGRPLELIADEPFAHKTIAFAGLDAWRARGVVETRLLSGTKPRIVAAATLDGDTVRLPPLPGRRATLEMTCNGLPFWQWPREVDLTAKEGEAWQLPSPRAVRIRVVAKGRPVPDAELLLRTIDPPDGMRELACPLGHTDARGDLVVTLPLPANRDFSWINYAFGVRAAGFEPVGNISRVDIPAKHDSTGEAAAMTLFLRPGQHHTLRLARGERAFAAAVACSTRSAGIGDDGYGNCDKQWLCVPDAQGRVTILRKTGHAAFVLAASAALERSSPQHVPLHAMAWLGTIEADEARRELAWDLAAPRTLVLEVVSADGVPAAGARIALLVEDGQETKLALAGLCTDRAGRIAVLVPAAQKMTVVAWTDNSFACVLHDAGDRLRLELATVATLPGKVIDKNGNPIAFAKVECYVSASTGNAASLALAKGLGVLEVATARDGTFQLPFYPGLQYSMRGVVTADDNHYFDQHWTVGKDEPEQLLLDLGKAR